MKDLEAVPDLENKTSFYKRHRRFLWIAGGVVLSAILGAVLVAVAIFAGPILVAGVIVGLVKAVGIPAAIIIGAVIGAALTSAMIAIGTFFRQKGTAPSVPPVVATENKLNTTDALTEHISSTKDFSNQQRPSQGGIRKLWAKMLSFLGFKAETTEDLERASVSSKSQRRSKTKSKVKTPATASHTRIESRVSSAEAPVPVSAGSSEKDTVSTAVSAPSSPVKGMNITPERRAIYAKAHYWHDVLGISSKASDEDIKKAARKLLLVLHPDKYPDKSEEGQKIAADQAALVIQAQSFLLEPNLHDAYVKQMDSAAVLEMNFTREKLLAEQQALFDQGAENLKERREGMRASTARVDENDEKISANAAQLQEVERLLAKAEAKRARKVLKMTDAPGILKMTDVPGLQKMTDAPVPAVRPPLATIS